jgi:hypothetical protein
MHPSLLIATLYYGLIFAGIVFVPGVVALALALATRSAASSTGKARPTPSACLWLVVHGFSRRLCVVLLATSAGLLGAGLVSVLLNVLLLIVVIIWDSVSPVAEPAVDMTLVVLLYVAALCVPFVACFAFTLNTVVKWLKPKDA